MGLLDRTNLNEIRVNISLYGSYQQISYFYPMKNKNKNTKPTLSWVHVNLDKISTR